MTEIVFPCTVRQLSEQLGICETSVREWIADGHFEIDPKIKPMTIIKGERPVTRDEWRKFVGDNCPLRPGTWGVNADGDVEMLIGEATGLVTYSAFRRDLPNKLKELDIARRQQDRVHTSRAKPEAATVAA